MKTKETKVYFSRHGIFKKILYQEVFNMITSIVLLSLFLFFVVIGAVYGLVRGMNKSLIRFITFLLAVVLTFFVSGFVTDLLAEKIVIEGQTLGQMLLETITANEIAAGIFAASPLLQEAVLTVPAFAIGIVVFPVVFILLSFLTWIVFLCIQRPLRKLIFKESFKKDKTEEEKKSLGVRAGKRFAGMGIGVVTGVLVFGMLFTPLFAVINLLPENSALNEAIDTLVEQQVLDAATAETIKQELTARDHFVLKTYDAIGMSGAGRLYLSSVSKFEYGSHRTNIPDELDPLFSAAQVLVDGGLLKAILNSNNPNAIFTVLANKAVVDELIGEMFKSKLLCSAVPEVLAIAMESLAITLKVPANKAVVYDNMMEDIADVVKNADIDYAAIKAYEEAHPEDVVDFAPLEEGEAPVIMTKEEYEAEKQKLTDLTLKISKIINIAVSGSDETVASDLAGKIVKNVTKNGVNVEEFNVDHVKVAISAISTDSVEGNAANVLAQLNDPEKFETNVATVETITASIRATVTDAMADSTKAQETATALSGAVSSFAGAIENAIDENGVVNVVDLDFGKIAEGVTGLQNSTLKDVGSSVLELVAAGDLGNDMVGDVIGAIKDSYDSGDNISGAINSAGALIQIGTSMGSGNGEESKENIANSFADLVHHLDDVTMKLLPNIVTSDLLVSLGADPAYTDLVYDVVETLLYQLMDLKGAEDYDNEVDAVLEIYDLAMRGVNNFVEEDIQTLIDSAMKSDAIYGTVIELGGRNEVLFEIEHEQDREFMIDGIERYFDESDKTEKERNLFMAFATAIGVADDVNLVVEG